MTEEPPQIPVYIITAPNWTMEVALDEYNAQFSKEDQLLEAATRAVEVFKMMREDCRIVMNPDSRDENPQLGTTILVHLKGTNPDAAANILTHVCMGNTGLYKDAAVMEAAFTKQVAEMRQKQQEREKQAQRQAQEAQDLDQMKTEILRKKPSKRKKK